MEQLEYPAQLQNLNQSPLNIHILILQLVQRLFEYSIEVFSIGCYTEGSVGC